MVAPVQRRQWAVPALQCRYCQQPFQPSRFHPKQAVCSDPACQSRRRAGYHRDKIANDPEYGEACRASQAKWNQAHPHHQRDYWRSHPQAAARNRQLQRRRDSTRRMADLVKNNPAIDLKCATEGLWLVGPGLDDLVGNNLARVHLVVFKRDPGLKPAPAAVL